MALLHPWDKTVIQTTVTDSTPWSQHRNKEQKLPTSSNTPTGRFWPLLELHDRPLLVTKHTSVQHPSTQVFVTNFPVCSAQKHTGKHKSHYLAHSYSLNASRYRNTNCFLSPADSVSLQLPKMSYWPLLHMERLSKPWINHLSWSAANHGFSVAISLVYNVNMWAQINSTQSLKSHACTQFMLRFPC